MEQRDDNEYLRGLPTEQLEDLARRPDIPVPHQRVIRSELVDRYTAELTPLTVYTGQTSPPAPTVRDAVPTGIADPAEPGPPSRSRRSWLPVLAATAVVIAAVILVGRSYVEHRARPAVPISTRCDVGGGYACDLPSAGPLGQPCTCVMAGYRYGGVLR